MYSGAPLTKTLTSPSNNETAVAESSSSLAASTDTRPSWMRALETRANEWLSYLPTTAPVLSRSAAAITNPLYRALEREFNIGVNLGKKIFVVVHDIGHGTEEYLRDLTIDIQKSGFELQICR